MKKALREMRACIFNRDLMHPPAHRDEAAMSGAQLLKTLCTSSGLMSGQLQVRGLRVELNSLRKVNFTAPIDGAGLAPHVSFPGIRT